MLTSFDLKTWINGLVPHTYYVNDFPAKSPDASAIVRLSASPPPSEWSNVIHPAFQIIVRGPADDGEDTAEITAIAIQGKLHNMIEFSIARQRVVHCIATQSTPFFIGWDEDRRPLYSLNFEMTMQT